MKHQRRKPTHKGMKRMIEIEDLPSGGVAVTCRSEIDGARTSSKDMFDLIERAVCEKFRPTKIHFVPIRKERTRR